MDTVAFWQVILGVLYLKMSSHHDSESRITQAGFLKEHLFIFSKEELAMDPGNHCSTHVHACFFFNGWDI